MRETETLPKPHIKQTSKYLWVNFLSNQALCTVQWNNAQIPDCVWPLAACFVKQWEAWPWWQPQDNSRPPWPLVSTRESHFMLFKTASETRMSFRVQSRFELKFDFAKWSKRDSYLFSYLSQKLSRKPSAEISSFILIYLGQNLHHFANNLEEQLLSLTPFEIIEILEALYFWNCAQYLLASLIILTIHFLSSLNLRFKAWMDSIELRLSSHVNIKVGWP